MAQQIGERALPIFREAFGMEKLPELKGTQKHVFEEATQGLSAMMPDSNDLKKDLYSNVQTFSLYTPAIVEQRLGEQLTDGSCTIEQFFTERNKQRLASALKNPTGTKLPYALFGHEDDFDKEVIRRTKKKFKVRSSI